MSWLFSRALVEASWQGSYLAGELSVLSSQTPTPQAYWWPGRTTEAFPRFPSGMTCEPLPRQIGQALSMWSAEASPVKTFPLPATEMDSTASAPAYGGRWQGSFAKFDPDSCLWRTAQRSLLGGWEPFLETWPRSGLMLDGECFLRPPLEPGTFESASGLWPTPVASDTGQRKAKYAQGGAALSLAVRLYPTPTAGNHKSGGYLGEWGGSRARERMREMVPAEEMFGPLNPQWVEWLMGWPTGWTDLKPLATAKFQEWQQQHSPRSPQSLSEAA